MSYYLTCREHDKNIRRASKICYKNSEKQRAIDLKELGDPLQLLRLNGQSVTLVKNQARYFRNESLSDFVCLNNNKDVIIDKYDCRSLLDYIPPDIVMKDPGPLTEEEMEINCLLNYERYRSLLLHLGTGNTTESLLKKVHQAIAARIVKMNHITERKNELVVEQNEDDDYHYGNSQLKRLEKIATGFGILGFKKINRFNCIEEHNRRALEVLKTRTKIARDLKVDELKIPRHKRRYLKLPQLKLKSENERVIEVSSSLESYSSSENSRHAHSPYSSYSERETGSSYSSDPKRQSHRKRSKRETSRGIAKPRGDDIGLLIATLDHLAQDEDDLKRAETVPTLKCLLSSSLSSILLCPLRSPSHLRFHISISASSFFCVFLRLRSRRLSLYDKRKPKTSTMKSFFPDLIPVDSVEEANSWTTADFQRRKGLRDSRSLRAAEREETDKRTKVSAQELEERERKTRWEDRFEVDKNSARKLPSGKIRAKNETAPLNTKLTAEAVKKTKLTPAEKMKARMRQAFQKTISKDKVETRRREEVRKKEMLKRERDTKLMQEKYGDKAK